jgi:hypothetical protein
LLHAAAGEEVLGDVIPACRQHCLLLLHHSCRQQLLRARPRGAAGCGCICCRLCRLCCWALISAGAVKHAGAAGLGLNAEHAGYWAMQGAC